MLDITLIAVKGAERPRRRVYVLVWVSILMGKKCFREARLIRSSTLPCLLYLSVCLSFSSFLPFTSMCPCRSFQISSWLVLTNQSLFPIHVLTLALPFVTSLVSDRKIIQRGTKFASCSCSQRTKGNCCTIFISQATIDKKNLCLLCRIHMVIPGSHLTIYYKMVFLLWWLYT